MSSSNIPDDVEAGKNFADEILQDLIREYGDRSQVNEWKWIYDPSNMHYRLRFTIPGQNPDFETFFRTELEDVDSTSRGKLRDKIRNIFMSKIIHS